MAVTFAKHEVALLGEYLATLEKQLVSYSISQDAHGYEVTITGH